MVQAAISTDRWIMFIPTTGFLLKGQLVFSHLNSSFRETFNHYALATSHLSPGTYLPYDIVAFGDTLIPEEIPGIQVAYTSASQSHVLVTVNTGTTSHSAWRLIRWLAGWFNCNTVLQNPGQAILTSRTKSTCPWTECDKMHWGCGCCCMKEWCCIGSLWGWCAFGLWFNSDLSLPVTSLLSTGLAKKYWLCGIWVWLPDGELEWWGICFFKKKEFEGKMKCKMSPRQTPEGPFPAVGARS